MWPSCAESTAVYVQAHAENDDPSHQCCRLLRLFTAEYIHSRVTMYTSSASAHVALSGYVCVRGAVTAFLSYVSGPLWVRTTGFGGEAQASPRSGYGVPMRRGRRPGTMFCGCSLSVCRFSCPEGNATQRRARPGGGRDESGTASSSPSVARARAIWMFPRGPSDVRT
jgi:hypothetical protein